MKEDGLRQKYNGMSKSQLKRDLRNLKRVITANTDIDEIRNVAKLLRGKVNNPSNQTDVTVIDHDKEIVDSFWSYILQAIFGSRKAKIANL